ncbi:MAG: chemotaxis protein CheD [Pseudomonadota bacterium]
MGAEQSWPFTKAEHVSQGEVKIATDPALCVGTILGSCVSTVIWDEKTCVGGINHVLLPTSSRPALSDHGYEVNLMELLINGILAHGGCRKRLRAKVFGGAQMIDGLGHAGEDNTAFVMAYLDAEGIPCLAQSTGGRHARRLKAWPATGRVLQKTLQSHEADREIDDMLQLRRNALRLSGVELL